MKKLLLLLLAFVMHMYGMQHEGDCHNQDPKFCVSAPVLLVTDQDGRPLVYDIAYNVYRPVYYPLPSKQVHDSQKVSQAKQGGSLVPCEFDGREYCDDVSSQKQCMSLEEVFQKLMSYSLNEEVDRVSECVDHLVKLLADELNQCEVEISSDDVKKQYRSMLLDLFKSTGAYSSLFGLASCMERFSDENRARWKGDLGLLLTHMTHPSDNNKLHCDDEKSAFELGYGYLYDAVDSRELPQDVKKKFRMRRKFCENLLGFKRPKRKKKQHSREIMGEPVPKDLFKKDAVPQGKPLKEVIANQDDHVIEGIGNAQQVSEQENNEKSDKGEVLKRKKKKKKSKKMNRKKEKNEDIDEILQDIKDDELRGLKTRAVPDSEEELFLHVKSLFTRENYADRKNHREIVEGINLLVATAKNSKTDIYLLAGAYYSDQNRLDQAMSFLEKAEQQMKSECSRDERQASRCDELRDELETKKRLKRNRRVRRDPVKTNSQIQIPAELTVALQEAYRNASLEPLVATSLLIKAAKQWNLFNFVYLSEDCNQQYRWIIGLIGKAPVNLDGKKQAELELVLEKLSCLQNKAKHSRDIMVTAEDR